MPRIIPLAEWYPAMARRWEGSPRRYPIPLSERRGWTIHHFGFRAATLERIRRVADDHFSKWQRPGGYNFCVYNGDVLSMCGEGFVGAHAPGGNRVTLGVAFPYSLVSNPPSQVDIDAARWLLGQVPIPGSQWPHSHWSATTCPGNAGRALLPLSPLEDDMAKLSEEAQEFYEQMYEQLKRREARPTSLPNVLDWLRQIRSIFQ